MSYETVRISELAKELGLPSKEVVEKFAQLGVTNKTHSSTVTLDQIRRLKEFIANGGVKKTQKPKAFVVKKAKMSSDEVTKETKQQAKPTSPKIEIVKSKSQTEKVDIRTEKTRSCKRRKLLFQNIKI